MSFHNISNRTGGEENVKSHAEGFINLVSLVREKENVPVVAGADFNIDCSVLTTTVRNHGCIMPDYESSERRISNDKIDLYVIKGTSSESEIEVGVFEALPLVDYNDRLEADRHALGYDGLRYLTDNAPVKNTGELLTYKEYNDVTNHDPIMLHVSLKVCTCTLSIHTIHVFDLDRQNQLLNPISCKCTQGIHSSFLVFE